MEVRMVVCMRANRVVRGSVNGGPPFARPGVVRRCGRSARGRGEGEGRHVSGRVFYRAWGRGVDMAE